MFKLLFSYLKFFSEGRRFNYGVLLFLGVLSAFLEAIGITVFFPVLSKNSGGFNSTGRTLKFLTGALDKIGVLQSITRLLLVIVALFMFKGLVKYAEALWRARLVTNFIFHLRSRLMRIYGQISYSYFSSRQKGEWTSFLISEPAFVQAGYEQFASALTASLAAGVLIAAASFLNFWLTFNALIAGGLVGWFIRKLSRQTAALSRHGSSSIKGLNDFLIQGLNSFKYFKATNTFGVIVRRAEEVSLDLARTDRRMMAITAIPNAIQQPTSVVILSVMIFYAVKIQGQDISSVLVTLAVIYRVFSNLLSSQYGWQAFANSRGYIDSLTEKFAELATHCEKEIEQEPLKFENEVRLQNICVNFQKESILRNVNLTIPRNKIIGILGKSGSGKTTLIDIILGIKTPTSGQVLVDGQILTESNTIAWRNKVGIVMQEVPLFSDTVSNNLTLWQLFPFHERKILESLAQANIGEVVNRSPEGLQSRIGDRGIQLSGGQKQRIAIARELYRTPEFLIFDEATSALDVESENQILQHIREMKNYTTIVIISHRMSTFKICDQIVVVKDGAVEGVKTYEEMQRDPHSLLSLMAQSSMDMRSRSPALRVRVEPESRISLSIWFNEALTPVVLRDISLTGISTVGDGFIREREVGGVLRSVLYLGTESIEVDLRLVYRNEAKAGFAFVELSSKGRDLIDNFVKFG